MPVLDLMLIAFKLVAIATVKLDNSAFFSSREDDESE